MNAFQKKVFIAFVIANMFYLGTALYLHLSDPILLVVNAFATGMLTMGLVADEIIANKNLLISYQREIITRQQEALEEITGEAKRLLSFLKKSKKKNHGN